MTEEESLEEKKAQIIIKLRKYKLVKKERLKEIISYLVRIPMEKQKAFIWCIPDEGTVGVAIVNRMQEALKKSGVDRGLIITSGKYTHAARVSSAKKHIELLPRTFPSFDIFDHVLVPKHEILAEADRKQVLSEYRVEPYQLPEIKASDPAVKAIGAKPGDILRILRDSATAGTHVAYRYVVD